MQWSPRLTVYLFVCSFIRLSPTRTDRLAQRRNSAGGHQRTHSRWLGQASGSGGLLHQLFGTYWLVYCKSSPRDKQTGRVTTAKWHYAKRLLVRIIIRVQRVSDVILAFTDALCSLLSSTSIPVALVLRWGPVTSQTKWSLKLVTFGPVTCSHKFV